MKSILHVINKHHNYRVEKNISRSTILVESFECSDEMSRCDTLCFLERSLPFTSDEDINIDVIARILAAFFSYSFINLEVSSRSLILYH